MAVKTNGAEFKRFYNDKKYWPEQGETYHEDVVFRVNGEVLGDDSDPSDAGDADEVRIEGGVVYHSPFHKDGDEPSLESYFRRWQKEQKTATIVVECDASVLEQVTKAVRAAGGKVLG